MADWRRRCTALHIRVSQLSSVPSHSLSYLCIVRGLTQRDSPTPSSHSPSSRTNSSSSSSGTQAQTKNPALDCTTPSSSTTSVDAPGQTLSLTATARSAIPSTRQQETTGTKSGSPTTVSAPRSRTIHHPSIHSYLHSHHSHHSHHTHTHHPGPIVPADRHLRQSGAPTTLHTSRSSPSVTVSSP